jgi:hypothetical protein
MLEEYMQMMFTKGSGNKLMNSYNMYRRHTDFLLESLVLFSICFVSYVEKYFTMFDQVTADLTE